MKGSVLAGVLLLTLGTAIGAGGDRGANSSKVSLVTVEGEIVAVERSPAEGGLEVVSIALVTEHGTRPDRILLAPEAALAEIGFTVGTGDRCRVSIFRGDDGPAPAHKILNFSRGTMVRLRTLRGFPLWDREGRWQGGPMRGHGRGHGHGHGHGGPGGR